MRVVVLGSGNGSNLRALLEHIQAGHVAAQVVAVGCDRPGARFVQIAESAGIPTQSWDAKAMGAKTFDATLEEWLQGLSADLVVLAGFMRIIPRRIVDAFAGRMINVHPSLLPSFPGAHGIRDAVQGGARLTGCTTHFVVPEVDAGPIILQAALAIRPDDDVDALARRVHRLEHVVLPRTVHLLATGRVAADGRVAPGDSWLDMDIDIPAGVLYSEGF